MTNSPRQTSHGIFSVKSSKFYQCDQFISILDAVGIIKGVSDDGTCNVDLNDHGTFTGVRRSDITFGLGNSRNEAVALAHAMEQERCHIV